MIFDLNWSKIHKAEQEFLCIYVCDIRMLLGVYVCVWVSRAFVVVVVVVGFRRVLRILQHTKTRHDDGMNRIATINVLVHQLQNNVERTHYIKCQELCTVRCDTEVMPNRYTVLEH